MRALLVVLCLAAGCESSAKVGEIREPEDAGPPAPPSPLDPPRPDAGPTELSWRLHAPIVPCSISAMAETRDGELYLGCNGGRIYRFDGVGAKLLFEVEDTRIFSLLVIAPDGQVWAGAQSGYQENATTQLYRFDGKVWSKVGGDRERIMALAIIDGAVWAASARELRRFDGTTFESVYVSTTGEFRSCSVAYCTGTEGLAVRWDGRAWSPMTGAPWPARAEVFTVEVIDRVPFFFYGEAIDHPNGDFAVRVARFDDTGFRAYTASSPTFPSYRLSRRRSGYASVNLGTYALLALGESSPNLLVFDTKKDVFRTLCGRANTFSVGLSKTRVGGSYGFLAAVVGSGADQLALDATEGSSTEFRDLSVAEDGSTWARIEDSTVCGSTSERLVRFQDGNWRDVAAPQRAVSGRGITAVSSERAYTLYLLDVLFEYASGTWTETATPKTPWSLWARRPDDLWLGTYDGEFGHYDGKSITVRGSVGKRKIEQIVATAPDNVWMVVQGYTENDTGTRLFRHSGRKLDEWYLGHELAGAGVHVSPLDKTHVWQSGAPARFFDGAKWKRLAFEASNVWARSAEEVYFTSRGDIYRFDGTKHERVFHGFIPITAIAGSQQRAIAVGPGGMTLELGMWPSQTK